MPGTKILKDNVVICGGSNNKEMARSVAGYLGKNVVEVDAGNFRDGETFIKLHENVNNKDVVIIQSMSKPVNESIMELVFTIATMKRNGASSVTAVIPYYAYARQERKVGPYRC